jgi:hypothetical protein
MKKIHVTIDLPKCIYCNNIDNNNKEGQIVSCCI